MRERLLAEEQRRLGAATRELEEQAERGAAAGWALALGEARSGQAGGGGALQLLLLDGQRKEAPLEDLLDEVEALSVGARGAGGEGLELGRGREELRRGVEESSA